MSSKQKKSKKTNESTGQAQDDFEERGRKFSNDVGVKYNQKVLTLFRTCSDEIDNVFKDPVECNIVLRSILTAISSTFLFNILRTIHPEDRINWKQDYMIVIDEILKFVAAHEKEEH